MHELSEGGVHQLAVGLRVTKKLIQLGQTQGTVELDRLIARGNHQSLKWEHRQSCNEMQC